MNNKTLDPLRTAPQDEAQDGAPDKSHGAPQAKPNPEPTSGNINDLKRDVLDIMPSNADIAEGREVVVGEALDSAEPIATREAMENALRQVFDPEIPVNIFDLGLIYELNQSPNGDVDVVMTLTAPACPVAGEMPGQVAEALAVIGGVGRVRVKLTWEPAWNMSMMSPDAKLALGFG
ncbi:MAG: iron-sulfur cluster assembly protein [Hydrotalea sp.]|nr:iron-sulfur cluster assembly protein [Hydrotalea sp.]